jgi:uncharacterized metal-binding protein
MGLGSFLLATVITLGVLFLIRVFWVELFIIYTILQILFYISVLSIISTVIWLLIFQDNSAGWGWIFAYCCTAYTGMIVVYGMIASDFFEMVVDWVRGIFGK